MRNLLLTLSCFLLLFSCKEQDSVLYYTDSDFTPVQLKATPLNQLEQLSPGSLEILDSLLVVTDYIENPRIHFYNKHSFKKIATYGAIGEGPEEYKEPEWNGQTFKIDDESEDVYFRIYEFGYGMIHDVNLSAVLRSEFPAKSNKHYLAPDIFNAGNVYFSNDTIFGEATYSEGIKYFRSSFNDIMQYNKLGVLNDDDILQKADVQQRINLDRSFLGFAPQHDMFVAAYLRFNRIIILDKQLNETKRIILGTEAKGPTTLQVPSNDNTLYFRGIYCAEDYFYASYLTDSDQDSKFASVIYVFDYQGNPVNKLELEFPARSYTIDESEKVLYVLTGRDDVPYVKYNLN